MGLKVAKVSRRTGDVQIKESFVVTFRHVTQSEKARLLDQIGTAADDVETRARQNSRKLSDLYVAGWRGLTPAILRSLGVDLEEDPPTDADGFVPFDAETGGDVWFEALPARYSDRVVQASHALLEEIEREKARAKNA